MQNDGDNTNALPTGQRLSFERERGVYALRVMHNIAHAVVKFGVEGNRSEHIERALKTISDAGAPIFLIKLHRNSITFALAECDSVIAKEAFQRAGYITTFREDLAMISVIAASMREVSGIMADISDALCSADAHMYETGDSHDSVQCLIAEERTAAALHQLCKTFHLPPEAIQVRQLQKGSTD